MSRNLLCISCSQLAFSRLSAHRSLSLSMLVAFSPSSVCRSLCLRFSCAAVRLHGPYVNVFPLRSFQPNVVHRSDTQTHAHDSSLRPKWMEYAAAGTNARKADINRKAVSRTHTIARCFHCLHSTTVGSRTLCIRNISIVRVHLCATVCVRVNNSFCCHA